MWWVRLSLARISGEFFWTGPKVISKFYLGPKNHRKFGPGRKSGTKIPWAEIHVTQLADIVQNAEQLISSFDEGLVIKIEAYKEYHNDRDEFDRKTRSSILSSGYPRT